MVSIYLLSKRTWYRTREQKESWPYKHMVWCNPCFSVLRRKNKTKRTSLSYATKLKINCLLQLCVCYISQNSRAKFSWSAADATVSVIVVFSSDEVDLWLLVPLVLFWVTLLFKRLVLYSSAFDNCWVFPIGGAATAAVAFVFFALFDVRLLSY